jgi:poly(A) polymerase Pap1
MEQVINYQDELKKLQEQKNSDFWKAAQGKNQIKILSEMEPTTPFVDQITKEEKPRVKLNIESEGKPFTWTITKGGVSSAYGQLIELAVKNKTLVGLQITVLVKDNGQRREYFIM